MFSNIVRAVARKGKAVTFTNAVGPFVGRSYEYRFPTTNIARAFESLVRSADKLGCPVAIAEEWRKYEVRREAII